MIQAGVAELDPAYHTYISALLDRGIAVAAASGRQIQSLQHIFKENADRMYLIGENGGQMVYHGADVDFKAIDNETFIQLIKDIKKIGRCEILISCPKVHYVEAKDMDLYHHLTEIVHNHVLTVRDFSEVTSLCAKSLSTGKAALKMWWIILKNSGAISFMLLYRRRIGWISTALMSIRARL